MKRCRSIFFRDNVRLGRAVGGANATRISLVEDVRYEVWIDEGSRVEIRDPKAQTVICVPWHMVRDFELAPVEQVTAPDSPRAKQASAGAKMPPTLA